jgi:hypothetical protein
MFRAGSLREAVRGSGEGLAVIEAAVAPGASATSASNAIFRFTKDSSGANGENSQVKLRADEKEKAQSVRAGLHDLTGRLPSLPHTRACSTIGAEGLNFRVRDGNGWNPLANTTQNLLAPDYDTELVWGFGFEYLTDIS